MVPAPGCAPAEIEPPTIVIRPRPGWRPIDLAEIWRYRGLLAHLAWRDLRVRYKQTLLGVAWALVQPLGLLAVFSLFIARTRDPEYLAATGTALVAWQLFATGLGHASNSLVDNERLVTKAYFPRLLLPLAAVGAGVTDALISLAVLLGLLAWMGPGLDARALAAPFLLALTMLVALAPALWLSALNARYRDVRYALPLLTQLWLLAAPIAYSSDRIPAAWQGCYALNPLVGVIECWRWCLLGHGRVDLLTISLASLGVLLVGGAYYFRRVERSFADVI